MPNAWDTVFAEYDRVRLRRIDTLFEDAFRFDAFSAAADGLVLDYSKTNIDADTRAALIALCEAAGVADLRDAMFRGDKINTTEDRAVLHTALRSDKPGPLVVDGVDVLADIRETRRAMEAFATGIRSGALSASDGAPFRDVVNIGIGGSDLGPAMATLALAPYHDGPRCHFVSNIDGAHIADTLAGLDPARTLVIIASKSFTTIETMTNAVTARNWLETALGPAASGHLAAVSSARDRTADWGIAPDRVFGFGDYIGGRYSVWGPVGLPVMLAVGSENFAAFLAGAEAMDHHFQVAEPIDNLPILLGLVGIWHNNICGYPSRAVLPYDQRLRRLPAYLQQLDMESNGKRVTRDGLPLAHHSGPVVWGAPGTNGQHAFFQLLHQGTDVIPAEFLIAAEGHEADLSHQHNLLKANCLAQSEAMMIGRPEAEDPHRVFRGNRPSVTIAMPKLTPFALGQILALYEHRVFVEGAIWGINSFDQFGVELGKELANALLPMVEGADASAKDSSTRGLLGVLGTRTV